MALKRNKSVRKQRELERKLVQRLKRGAGGRLPEWKTNRGHEYCFKLCSHHVPTVIGIAGGCRWFVTWKEAFEHYARYWRTDDGEWPSFWQSIDRETERRHCRAVLHDMQRIARLAGLKLGALIKKKQKATKKRKRRLA